MYGGGDALKTNGLQEWEKAEILEARRAAGLNTEGCGEACPMAIVCCALLSSLQVSSQAWWGNAIQVICRAN